MMARRASKAVRHLVRYVTRVWWVRNGIAAHTAFFARERLRRGDEFPPDLLPLIRPLSALWLFALFLMVILAAASSDVSMMPRL